MPVRSFQTKLLYLMVATLVLLQAATLIAVHFAGERRIRHSIAKELRVGSKVFDSILASRGVQLAEYARVAASDFAFREAIALSDRDTVTSVLANHGERIGADAAMLVSLDGVVSADTLSGRLVGQRFAYDRLLREADERGSAAAVVTFVGRPYQLVVVPVLAPQAIAWVCMAFTIDHTVLTDVKRMTSLDASLWTSAGKDRPFVSTLTADQQRQLTALTGGLPAYGDLDRTIWLGEDDYQALQHPLVTGDGSRIYTLLQRSIAEAAEPYRRLELQIFAMSTIALLGAIVAAIFFARGVSRPLQTLAAGAQRIERGDYGQPIDVPQADEIGRLATAFDRMRTGIAEREDHIRHQATHDALTGLPNRSLFFERLEQTIADAAQNGQLVATIIMDVNRFKEINDTLGHPFGDELLVEIGRRLRETLAGSDIVARLGGDEFAVTFVAAEGARPAELAGRIMSAFQSPFVLAGVSIEVNASIGIALYPIHATDAATLMKRADIAMYDSKKRHGQFAVYEPGRDEHSLRRLMMLSDLRQAISRDELELHYQPKVGLNEDGALHAEALVRWRHAEHGMLPPDEFIPIAEQSGSIGLLTRWVLRRAIADCAQWNDSGLDVTVAVNLSALDLFDPHLPAYIRDLLAAAGLPASRIGLELTESAIMNEPAQALRVLRDLKALGITLAIDDFGTGYSSLAQLKRLPVDELKIDKSFVLNLRADSNDDLVIVRSTIELAHNMGLRVIAEGVEHDEGWKILQEMKCDMAQGYFVSRPLPASEFRRWAEQGTGFIERARAGAGTEIRG